MRVYRINLFVCNALKVAKAEVLRLIYQGRFLHGNVTLSALGLPTAKTAVMHLVPRYRGRS